MRPVALKHDENRLKLFGQRSGAVSEKSSDHDGRRALTPQERGVMTGGTMSPQVDWRQWQTRSFRVSCGQVIRWWKSIVFKRCRSPPNYSTGITLWGRDQQGPRPRPQNPPSPFPSRWPLPAGQSIHDWGSTRPSRALRSNAKLLAALAAKPASVAGRGHTRLRPAAP